MALRTVVVFTELWWSQENVFFLQKVRSLAWFHTLILAQIEDLRISVQVYSRWGAPLRAQDLKGHQGGYLYVL